MSPKPRRVVQTQRAVSVSISVWTSLVSVTCASSRTSPTSRRRACGRGWSCRHWCARRARASLAGDTHRSGQSARSEVHRGEARRAAMRFQASRRSSRRRGSTGVPASRRRYPDASTSKISRDRSAAARSSNCSISSPCTSFSGVWARSMTKASQRPAAAPPERLTVVGQRSLEPLGGLGPVGDRRADVQRDRDALEPLQALAQCIGVTGSSSPP